MSETDLLIEISGKLDTVLVWQEYIVAAIIMVGSIYLAKFILHAFGVWDKDAQ